MSQWGSRKARLVLSALLGIGWQIKWQSGGSHRVLARSGWADFVFAFDDGEEIGRGCSPELLGGRVCVRRTSEMKAEPGCRSGHADCV